MGLKEKDVALVGTWLTQVKTVAETAEDPSLKETAQKLSEALTSMLGADGVKAVEAATAAQVAEAAQVAQVAEAASQVAAAARKLTGKDKSEEVLATISSWKERAEKTETPELETLRATVTGLTARVAEGEIKELLASNREKCNPAFEAWALKRDEKGNLVRTAADVTEALATREVKATTQLTSLPNPGSNSEEVTLTAADREVCELMGTDPAVFLKHKTEEFKAAQRARKAK